MLVHGQQGDDDLSGRVVFGGSGKDTLRDAPIFDVTERDSGREASPDHDSRADRISGWRGLATVTDHDPVAMRPTDPR